MEEPLGTLGTPGTLGLLGTPVETELGTRGVEMTPLGVEMRGVLLATRGVEVAGMEEELEQVRWDGWNGLDRQILTSSCTQSRWRSQGDE